MEKSRMYQLYELRDELKKAIKNSQVVEDSERLLAKIILQSKESEQFTDFVKGLTSNWKDYEHTRIVLNTRLEKINHIISLYEKQDEVSKVVDDVVSCVIESFGMASPESKKAEA